MQDSVSAGEEFLRCPKCHGGYWTDVPNPADPARTRFRCARCGHGVLLAGCAKCRARKWMIRRGIDPKGGHRPYYRLQCGGCGRVIGVLIDS